MSAPTPAERERIITWRVPIVCTCLSRHPDEDMIIVALTVRQSDIARCLTRGLTNQEIVDEQVIDLQTVKNHVSAILAKLGVHDRTKAALMLLKHGVTSD